MKEEVIAIIALLFAASCSSTPEPVQMNYADTGSYPLYYYQ